MLALTPSERRGALVLVLLLLVGAGHDLWRARREPSGPQPGPILGPEADGPEALPSGPATPGPMSVPEARHATGFGAALDSAAMEAAPGRRVAAARRAPVDLNRAGVGDLDRLPGIGPVLAGRIVLQRQRFGPFREVDELLAVRGVGPRLLERIRPWAIVQPAPIAARPVGEAGFDSTAATRR